MYTYRKSVNNSINDLFSFLALIVFCIFYMSCAQIVPLTGGNKDIDAPKMLGSLPENFSTNTFPKTIEIEFDEYIQLKNLNSELSVCPPMDEDPDIYVKDKKLIIKIQSKLDSNATYNINLGNALVDFNEGNPYKSFKYVFSTGKILDTLTIHGKLINAFNNEPKEGVYVFLYNDINDSLPYSSSPRYYTKTDKYGFFELNYLRDVNYKIFALNEKTGNFIYDSPEEEIAFIKNVVKPFYQKPIIVNDSSALDSINLDSIYDDSNLIELRMFTEDKAKQFVKNSAIKGKELVINLNRESQKIKVESIDEEKLNYYVKETSPDSKSVSIWLKDVSDSLSFIISDDDLILDTLLISSIEKKSKKDTLVKVSSNIKDNFLEFYDSLTISSKTPIDSIDLSNIILIKNTDTISDTISDFKIDFLSKVRCFKILYPYKEKELYTVFVMPNAIADVYNTTNDTTTFMFVKRSSDYYGELSIDINMDSLNVCNRIFQLIDKDDNILYEELSFDKSKVVFSNVLPNEYTLKIIDDTNCNGVWDTGDYLKKIQPEKIYFYHSILEISSGWTMDIMY